MRFQSKKQAAIYREWSPRRQLWLGDQPWCFVCGGRSTEVHEIFNGPLRMKSFVERAAWLALCTDCNQNKVTDKRAFPIEKQLAYKLVFDAAGFDLDACRRIVCPRVITEADILEWVRIILVSSANWRTP